MILKSSPEPRDPCKTVDLFGVLPLIHAMSTAQADSLREEKPEITEYKWYSLRIGVDPLFSPIQTLFDGVDTLNKVVMTFYFIVTIVAYFWMLNYSSWARQEGESLLCEWFSSYYAGALAVDILIFTFVFLFWMGFDRIQHGFSIYSYILLILSCGGAIAFVAPFYLGLRVSRECKIKNNIKNTNISNSEKGFCYYCQSMIPCILWLILVGFYVTNQSAPFGKPNVCTDE